MISRKSKLTSIVRSLTIYTLTGLLALLFFTPIGFMIIGSLKPDAQVLAEAGSLKAFFPSAVTLHNYFDVFSRVRFARYMFNSLLITVMVVGWGLVVNSLAGYAFARLRWRSRDILLALVLAILILPIEAIAVPLFYQVTLLGWRNTYIVQIVPFIANAFSVFLFYTYFLNLPRELEEAAWIDGASIFRTYVRIIVPSAKPVFATVAILTFLTQWGLYLWPLMVTSHEAVRPLPLAVTSFYTLPPLQWGDIFAFGVMMVTPILLVFLLFQSWFVRGIAATGLKG